MRLLLLCLTFLCTAPAMADVTAHYRTNDGEGMVIRLSDTGEALIEHGKNTAYLKTGGETYLILSDTHGRFTTRLKTFSDALRALPGTLPPPPAERYSILETGEETIAGFVGRRLSVGTEGSRQGRMDIVVSDAPELRALGRVVADHIESWFTSMPGSPPELVGTLETALGQGALLRLGPLFAMERIDAAPLSTKYFELPNPPLDLNALIKRLGLPKGN